MTADPAAMAAVSERLLEAGVQAANRLIVVHVSAGNPFRRWLIDHFAALVAALARADLDRRIIVTSGPSEGDASARVIAAAQGQLPVAACPPRCG
jgi:ADP-heptose:LPS heptosyltransferase